MERVIELPGYGGVGILTPAGGAANATAVVLFNAGLIHRSGPQRLHVDLARRLAARGFHVLRFDLPGIGDAMSAGAAPTTRAAIQALDAVQATTGASNFVIGGICSAADLGWRVALADARVQGLLMIDGMAVGGTWYRLGKLRMALGSSPASWPGKLLRRLRRDAAHRGDSSDALVDDLRDWPAPHEFTRQAAELLDRGLNVLALYTGGVADYLLHPRQIDRTFGPSRRHPGLRVIIRFDMDHIFFALRHRREAIGLIGDWLQDTFHER
ncbi:hypothetical protein E2F46_01100 [Luteimonas aestuarii]|uniref:Alpha/beta hydrolase n=1 Tax=Luteimonas aestuarii TaxID=453837 RepID=A0A4R5U480_9GAMM|nr:hypothetical protein [Luteimonas aestuarii]TDK28517.1 hypothetical protein E2F46_01100 [Luteimonas aestuarii]